MGSEQSFGVTALAKWLSFLHISRKPSSIP